MGKIKQQLMDLNRETAMRLWNKSFGKDTKAVDFAGRTIAKGLVPEPHRGFPIQVHKLLFNLSHNICGKIAFASLDEVNSTKACN